MLLHPIRPKTKENFYLLSILFFHWKSSDAIERIQTNKIIKRKNRWCACRNHNKTYLVFEFAIICGWKFETQSYWISENILCNKRKTRAISKPKYETHCKYTRKVFVEFNISSRRRRCRCCRRHCHCCCCWLCWESLRIITDLDTSI